MPICKRCGNKFPNSIDLDGRRRFLHKRSYCLVCEKLNTISAQTEKQCSYCKEVKPTTEYYPRQSRGRKGFSAYCRKCIGKQNAERARQEKLKCLEYKGSKCEVCGYSKYVGALEFHHRNPIEKDFAISKIKVFDDKMRRELDKCDLLCSNCHKERHSSDGRTQDFDS